MISTHSNWACGAIRAGGNHLRYTYALSSLLTDILCQIFKDNIIKQESMVVINCQHFRLTWCIDRILLQIISSWWQWRTWIWWITRIYTPRCYYLIQILMNFISQVYTDRVILFTIHTLSTFTYVQIGFKGCVASYWGSISSCVQVYFSYVNIAVHYKG